MSKSFLDEDALNRYVNDLVKKSQFDYECPKCHNQIKITVGRVTCPYCGSNIKIEYKDL